MDETGDDNDVETGHERAGTPATVEGSRGEREEDRPRDEHGDAGGAEHDREPQRDRSSGPRPVRQHTPDEAESGEERSHAVAHETVQGVSQR